MKPTAVSAVLLPLRWEHVWRSWARQCNAVITHSPQVAARGRFHFRIAKTDPTDGVISRTEPLQSDARIEEISRMISGSRHAGSPGCCPAADGVGMMQADIDSMTDIEAAAELQKLANRSPITMPAITVMMT